jgi:hypothetical protein
MKLSDKTKLTRSGKLVPLISKWDTENKGLSRGQLRDLAIELALENPELLISSVEEIDKEIISNRLVAYDTQSGLWFVCVRMPVSPYPEDFKSPQRLKVEARKARCSLEEQLFNRSIKLKYCQEKGLRFFEELSVRDFEKWKLENEIVFTPGIKESEPEEKSHRSDDTYSV